MDWAAIATGIGVFAIVAFHLVDHHRSREKNQKHEGEIRGASQNELQHIQDELQDPNHGLDALNNNLSRMRENCASFTSQFSERLINLEGRRSHKRKNSSTQK